MPWVVEMAFTDDQAKALRLGGIHPGRVERWYLKEREALYFVTAWLPRYGRVAVELSVELENKPAEIRPIPVGLPDPIPNHVKTPAEFAQPIIPGVVTARLYHTRRKPPFLPIIDLKAYATRRQVEEYLAGCSFSEVCEWLAGVGDLEFMEDVSLSGKPEDKVHKYRYRSRQGYETIVDITARGIHIVY